MISFHGCLYTGEPLSFQRRSASFLSFLSGLQLADSLLEPETAAAAFVQFSRAELGSALRPA